MNVVYVQPYVAGYRVPLYRELSKRLHGEGGSLTVASTPPKGMHRLRADGAATPWNIDVSSWTVHTPVGEFKYRSGLRPLIRAADVCVMELDVGNLNAWTALFRRNSTPLVLWGHGKSFTAPTRPGIDRLRALQARRAQHVMTYSPSGRRHLVDLGVPATRVTSVGNSTDTELLRYHLAERRNRPIDRSEAFRMSTAGRQVAFYVGGLDGDKRVPFLIEAARAAQRIDPSFLLLVAGSGQDQALVQQAVASRTCIAWIPHADAAALADMAAVSRCIWMPGRVGLIAVDALALGLPIFSTPFPYHAPEFEFLVLGESLHVLPDDPEHFARTGLEYMRSLDAPRRPFAAPNVREVADAMFDVLCGIVKHEKRETQLEGP